VTQNDTVAVVGAGIVGVCCALELRRRGIRVSLIDRALRGQETSYGNAGVLTRSSLVPLNNPGLWGALPTLLSNRSVQLRCDAVVLVRNARWALEFLARANRWAFAATASALDELIRLSITQHRRLLLEAGIANRLRDSGWLFLYRNAQAYEMARLAQETFNEFGVATQTLDGPELAELEPGLKPIFERALWIKDAASVDDPGHVVASYVQLFSARGGTVERREITTLEHDDAY